MRRIVRRDEMASGQVVPCPGQLGYSTTSLPRLRSSKALPIPLISKISSTEAKGPLASR